MELTKICSLPSPITTASSDFTLYKGITFRPVFKFKDKQLDIDGNPLPLPLTGIIVTFHIEDGDELDILTINSSSISTNGSRVIITDIPNGIADILITNEETELLDFEWAYWWVTLTLTNGDVILRGRGKIYLYEPYV